MKRIVVWLPFLLLMLTLGACAGRVSGYGVILWPPTDSALQAGDQVAVVDRSDIQETLTVSASGEEFEIAAWRVLEFELEDAAAAYADEYTDWADTYARSLRTALPVRERPDRTTTRVYRLRDGELVKVLDRQAEQSDEGGLVDYWYQVLAGEGVTGWAFGYHLELTSASGRPLIATEDRNSSEDLLQEIAAVTWRPDYFGQMIESDRIVLDRFSTRFGLFVDTDEQQVRIVLPGLDRTYRYNNHYSPERNLIQFEGASVSLRLVNGERISAQYSVSGRERASTFIRVTEDVAEIVANERTRRQRRLGEILERGDRLISTAFGTITLGERGTVSWQGFDRLVPTVLPPGFDGTASVSFPLFLSDDLRTIYDGVLRMRVRAGVNVAFLYTFVDDGIRLVYVPEEQISDDLVVTDEPISPVVMFYRFV